MVRGKVAWHMHVKVRILDSKEYCLVSNMQLCLRIVLKETSMSDISIKEFVLTKYMHTLLCNIKAFK